MPTLGKSLESLNDLNLRKVYNILFNLEQQQQNNKMEIVETQGKYFNHSIFMRGYMLKIVKIRENKGVLQLPLFLWSKS